MMNREMEIRSRLTPEVFDETGRQLAVAGAACGCGVRIAGAGGGGCVWALGEPADVARLKGEWGKLLASRKDARLLDVHIDSKGVVCTAKPFAF
jgi:D-glycero-alpha-D-manno-heptose-7-phosphate kinase